MICRDALAAGALEGAGAGVVADDYTDLGFEVAAPAGVDDCLKVGAAAGSERAEAEFSTLHKVPKTVLRQSGLGV